MCCEKGSLLTFVFKLRYFFELFHSKMLKCTILRMSCLMFPRCCLYILKPWLYHQQSMQVLHHVVIFIFRTCFWVFFFRRSSSKFVPYIPLFEFPYQPLTCRK